MVQVLNEEKTAANWNRPVQSDFFRLVRQEDNRCRERAGGEEKLKNSLVPVEVEPIEIILWYQ